MKYITEKEFEELELSYTNSERRSKWWKLIRNIPEGKSLVITKEEWTNKTPIKDVLGGFRRRKNEPLFFKSHKLRDGSGWVVRRVDKK